MKCELWQRRYKCGERWRNLYGAMVSGARLYARATTCWSQMVLAGPGSEEQVDHSYADQHHQLQLYLDIGNTNHCQHSMIICPHTHHPIHKTRPIRQRLPPRRSEPDQMVLARLRVRGTDQALRGFYKLGLVQPRHQGPLLLGQAKTNQAGARQILWANIDLLLTTFKPLTFNLWYAWWGVKPRKMGLI